MCKNPLEPSYIHCILIHDLQVVWWGKNINNLQVAIYLSHSVRFLFTRSAHPTFNNIPLHKDSLHGGLEYFFLQQMIKKKRTEANVQPCAMMYSIYIWWWFHHFSLSWARVTGLTWGHPWIWWSLLSGIGLLPVKVIVSALAVPTRCQRLLKVTIACDKRKKFIWLYSFSINLLLNWMRI